MCLGVEAGQKLYTVVDKVALKFQTVAFNAHYLLRSNRHKQILPNLLAFAVPCCESASATSLLSLLLAQPTP